LEFPKKDVKTFVELGLSLVETKIFLTLTQNGTLKVQKISDLSKVSRGDVYRNLSKLQDHGLIKKQISRPALFTAIPIKDAIECLLKRQKIKHKKIQQEATKILDKYNQKNATPDETSGFVFVPSKETLIRQLNKAIVNTKNSIEVSTTCKRLTAAGHSLADNLLKAWDRGVKGRVIIDYNEGNVCESIKDFWTPPRANIRYLPQIPRTVMAMLDRKEIFIFIRPKERLYESPALWSNVPSIVAMAEDYFDILWTTAMKSPKYHLDDSEQ